MSPHIVTFDPAGGTPHPADQTVNDGDKANKPTDPVRDGHVFTGWNLDNTGYDFNSPVNRDITLVAQWKPVSDSHGDIGPAKENGTWGSNDDSSGRNFSQGNPAYGGYTSAAEQAAAIAAGMPAIKGDYTYGGYGSAAAQSAAIAAGLPMVKAVAIPRTADSMPFYPMVGTLCLSAAGFILIAALKRCKKEY